MKSAFVLLCLIWGTFAAQVNFKDLNVPFHSSIGIDYHAPTDSLIVSTYYASGGVPHNFERIEQDGTDFQFSTISGLTDEVKIATVKENDPLEPPGTFYVGTGTPGQIARVTADGSSINMNWVNLPGEPGLLRGSLYVDRTGVFHYDLIGCTTAGGLWRIDRVTKVATKIASKGVHLEGIITVPNDASKYGFMAGKILVGAENERDLHWADANGNSGKWHLASVRQGNADVAVEDIDLIEGNFYAVCFGIQKIYGAPASEFTALRGNLLLTMEYAGLFVLTWDFVNNVPITAPLDFSAPISISQFEHVTFAPFGITTIPDPDDQCNKTGTYHTQSEGDWGDQCDEGFETGCYRDANFAKCFPNGIDVGCKPCLSLSKKYGSCGFHIHLDTSADVENFLPQLGAPGVLDHDYINPQNPPPMSTSSGNFGGQVTALALSLGFEACDHKFHTACGKLEDLYVCDDRCSTCKRNGNCRKNSNGCKFLREEELEIEEEDELDLRTNKHTNFNNNNNGKPKYANCEAYFGMQVKDIFATAQKVLGGCSSDCAGPAEKRESERNNKNNNNCVRTNKCRRSEEARNNKNCNRNNNCKKNKNCCCCPQQADPMCDPVLLNNCITLINQAFIFGKTLDDVQSGHLFKEKGCNCGLGFEWIATIGETTVPLEPFVVPIDVTSYYGFGVGDAASANTPDGLEDTNADNVLIEFVTDGFGLHNLLVIYDKPNSGSGGSANARIIHSGNLNAATFILDDDPGEGINIIPGLATASHNWGACCTDGYVFGPIPNLACFTFELDHTTGIRSVRLASKGAPGGTAISIPKADGDSVVIDICNRCKAA